MRHAFDYRLMMAYLDLDELDQTVGPRGVFSSRKFAWASFLPGDHLLGPRQETSLGESVRTLVEQSIGHRPAGPVRLLTQLRYCGHYFSPLNLYYCYAAEGEKIQAIVAEVSNTPWNERHHYVLHEGNRLAASKLHRYQHVKAFHVSPFMGMSATYDWRLNAPATRLIAQIRSRGETGKSFDATLVLRRRELSRQSARSLMIRYPLMNARILAAIYWQALLLWKKKCPFFPHPQSQTPLK